MSTPPLGEEFLDIPITQREAQLELDRVLDDHLRKVMAAIGDFSRRANLPSASLPGYPVKTDRAFAAPNSGQFCTHGFRRSCGNVASIAARPGES